MNTKKLAKWVKEQRASFGYTQTKLAELSGLDSNRISNIETGKAKRITDANIAGLAKAFEVSAGVVSTLLDDTTALKGKKATVKPTVEAAEHICTIGIVENTLHTLIHNMDSANQKSLLNHLIEVL
jgi:transcriptional regulator with XRE-family HTH domain